MSSNSNISRRRLLTSGLAATAGATGLVAAVRIAGKNGLIPPDNGGLYGIGETLNYASHKILAGNTPAREFDRSQISNPPFANGKPPQDEAFKRHQEAGFVDWRLAVDGLVARPASLSLSEVRSYPTSSQITHLACEEGWSYIAEWTGVPLSRILNVVGASPQAKYVVYASMEEGWWDSMDIAEAMHPQTLVAHKINGGDLPPGLGGPLRMRVPRQLGYKSVKYINRITVTDNIKSFGKGLGSAAPEGGYAWYAGI
jgi:DMSO/TMAO reductase YedYZ molybdopterin-dependent catalytic subunit